MTEAPSPFLPDSKVQYAWDSTSIGAFKKCPRYYFYIIVEGWRSRSESCHLTFGIHYHKALERYDLFLAQGADAREAEDQVIQLLLEETFGWESDHKLKNRETLLRSVVWYLEEYRNDVAHTLILANGKPAVELSFRFDTGVSCAPGQNYLLSGHMDRMVDFGGNHFVMDRKTSGSTLGGYYFSQYSPDNQMSLYTLASRVVYDHPVSGVIIDAVQVAVGFSAFSRGITMRSEGQLDEWLDDTFLTLETARRYAELQHWPMNEMSCNNYGGCAFKNICSKDPAVREIFLKNDFEIRKWNPLETR